MKQEEEIGFIFSVMRDYSKKEEVPSEKGNSQDGVNEGKASANNKKRTPQEIETEKEE